MSNTTDNNIATTILDQLGGARRLCGFTSAKDFLDLGNGVQFRIGQNAKRVNRVVVELAADDTYTVRFLRITKRGLDVKVLAEFAGIYCDMLVELFERETGLFLSF